MTFDPTDTGVWPIIAFFIPLLAMFVKQQGFTTQVNALIAFATYIVAGLLYIGISGVQGGFTFDNLVLYIGSAVVVGTASYNLFWNNLGRATDSDPSLDERLTAATSIVK